MRYRTIQAYSAMGAAVVFVLIVTPIIVSKATEGNVGAVVGLTIGYWVLTALPYAFLVWRRRGEYRHYLEAHATEHFDISMANYRNGLDSASIAAGVPPPRLLLFSGKGAGAVTFRDVDGADVVGVSRELVAGGLSELEAEAVMAHETAHVIMGDVFCPPGVFALGTLLTTLPIFITTALLFLVLFDFMHQGPWQYWIWVIPAVFSMMGWIAQARGRRRSAVPKPGSVLTATLATTTAAVFLGFLLFGITQLGQADNSELGMKTPWMGSVWILPLAFVVMAAIGLLIEARGRPDLSANEMIADLITTRLTNNPAALASALAKVEQLGLLSSLWLVWSLHISARITFDAEWGPELIQDRQGLVEERIAALQQETRGHRAPYTEVSEGRARSSPEAWS